MNVYPVNVNRTWRKTDFSALQIEGYDTPVSDVDTPIETTAHA
jgi:hypothetical protein